MEFDQIEKNLNYLNHMLRNGTTRIQGCFKEIEITLREMAEAVKMYREEVTTEHTEKGNVGETGDHPL